MCSTYPDADKTDSRESFVKGGEVKLTLLELHSNRTEI